MILCVTGPMAAGKNAASAILESKGFSAIDADILAHIAVDNAKNTILNTFGEIAREKKINLLNEDDSINRRELGRIVFSNKDLIKQQENIVYPEINRLLEKFIQEHSRTDIAVNATVLYKVPIIHKIDFILYIDSPFIIRFFRAKKRDGMKSLQILSRFKMQHNLFTKYKKANADIRRVWNIGSREQLEKKIDYFLTESRLRG
ncbi:MAG: dephospho-CoA kinase [Treponema sp.]|nr:dephospho-CoA kinase [Treponema sp.]